MSVDETTIAEQAIAEIARDEATFTRWRRRAFPFFERKICLTHASVSPLPRAVSEAIIQYSMRLMNEGQFDFVHQDIYNRCKERVATLIGSSAVADEVAFCSSTSHAIGTVATGLNWQSGDNCVVADGDFPANVVPWKNLRHRHDIEVRMIPYQPQMKITLEQIKPLVDERTRIVSLASANFLTGYPIDLETIGAWLHERGVLFCVDAIQTLGAARSNAKHVDFVCADAHKWLLGPNGIAILWSRISAMQQLHPALMGWLAPQGRDNWFDYDTTPIDNAERFEPGARNYLGIVALDAALGLHEQAGIEWAENRIASLRDHAARMLQKKGCNLLWNPDPDLRAGIVSFQPQDGQTMALYKKLDKNFALSIRQDKSGQEWIRISAHWMNTIGDIDALAAHI